MEDKETNLFLEAYKLWRDLKMKYCTKTTF